MNLCLDFTRLCNSHCTTCSIWKTKNPETLELKYIEKLLSQIEDMGNIYVTGGEPYINPIILDIARLVKKYHPKATWGGATNAISPDTLKRILEIRDMGIDISVDVSLEGDQETHDSIRGTDGNYEKVMELIIGLRMEGIPFIISSTTDTGREEAARLRLPVIQNTPRSGERYNTEEKDIKTKWITNCFGGLDIIFCLPNGDIYPCEIYKPELRLGNIKKDGYKDFRWDEVLSHISEGKCKPCTMSCWF